MKKHHILIAISLVISAFLMSCDSKSTSPTTTTDSTNAVILNGQVVASETGNPLSGAIIKVSNGSTVQGGTTDTDGKFSISFALSEDSDLQIVAFKAGYFQDTTNIFAIVNSTMDLPIFQLDRDKSSNAAAYSGKAASIYLYSQTADFVGVTASGSPENVDVTFEVSDSSGIVIGENNSVVVSFRFGSNPNGGEYLYPSSIITNSVGKATVSMKTGTKAGVAQIIAEAVVDGKAIASKPVSVTIHGGFPDAAHFSIGSDKFNYPYYHIINGQAKVTVLIGDKYSNPVRSKTSVYFSSDAAVIGGSALTNDMGVASVDLLSGNPLPYDATYQGQGTGDGFFWVHATTIDENEEEISTNARILFSGVPVVHLYPLLSDTLGNVDTVSYVSINNGGSQSFYYTVTDEYGHPLSSGSTYSVGVATEGDAGAAGDINVSMPDVQEGNTKFFFSVHDTKPEEYKAAAITVTVNISGPNGKASVSAEGLTH